MLKSFQGYNLSRLSGTCYVVDGKQGEVFRFWAETPAVVDLNWSMFLDVLAFSAGLRAGFTDDQLVQVFGNLVGTEVVRDSVNGCIVLSGVGRMKVAITILLGVDGVNAGMERLGL